MLHPHPTSSVSVGARHHVLLTESTCSTYTWNRQAFEISGWSAEADGTPLSPPMHSMPKAPISALISNGCGDCPLLVPVFSNPVVAFLDRFWGMGGEIVANFGRVLHICQMHNRICPEHMVCIGERCIEIWKGCIGLGIFVVDYRAKL